MNISVPSFGSNAPKRWLCVWVIAWLGISTLWGVDTDGDGYSDEEENYYDWNVSLVDQRIRGGFSRTDSGLIGVSLNGGGLVRVSSDPSGMIPEYTVGLESNSTHLTAPIDPLVGNKRFLYWERNGQIVRGAGGVPMPEVNEQNASAGVQLTARFSDSTEDRDGDGLEDWLEKKVQDMSLNISDDPDGDGYTLLQEQEHGFSPFLRDSRRRGGTSSSRSAVASVTLGQGGVLDVGSDPAGLIDSVSLPMSNEDSYTTQVVKQTIGDMRFLYWERDGEILRGPGGVPVHSYTENNIGWGKTLTARFLDKDQKTTPGQIDWRKLRLGGLHLTDDYDGDGDGYDFKEEVKYGFSEFLVDTRRRGGFSRSDSAMLTIHPPDEVPSPPVPSDADGDGIADVFDLDTDGDGSTDEEEMDNGTNPNDAQSFRLDQQYAVEEVLRIDFSQNEVTPLQSDGWEGLASSVDGPAAVSGSFSSSQAVDGSLEVSVSGQTHWRDYTVVNQGPYSWMNSLLSDVVFCNNGGTITLTLKDLKPGRYLMKTYHHLSEDYGDTTFDIRVSDAAGTNRLEHEGVGTSHGTAPQVLSTRDFTLLVSQNSDDVNVSIGPGGGITNHMGVNGFELSRFLSENPTSIFLSNNEVMENQPYGTAIGQFDGTDPDENASLEFSLISGVGAVHNNLLFVDQNGTLRTFEKLDREALSNLYFRAEVVDEFGASLEKIFTVRVTDDPAEDNTAPHELTLSPLNVSEDLSVGGKVGEFAALDIDVNATQRFELIVGNGSSHNGHFQLDANGSLFLTSPLDFETNQTMSIRAVVIDEYNGSLEGNFSLQVLDVFEDLDGDGTEDHLDEDEDGDGFSNIIELAYPSDPRDPSSVANTAPVSISFSGGHATLYENSANATIISQLTAVDPDPNDTLSYSMVNGVGATNNDSFLLSPGGLLRSGVVFDFETYETNQSIRVRVEDQHGAYFESNMTVRLLNVVEDLDGDGIEDHYDPDDDGDGFSDLVEIAYPSNPRDAGSVANVPPDNFWVTGNLDLNISENEANGTVVGSLMASDPDANASLRFLLSDDANQSFTISESGVIRTIYPFDYETEEQVRTIGVIVYDQHNASLAGTVEIEILNVFEDLDGDGIEDHYDLDDDGDGFSDLLEIGYPSDPRDANSWANTPPNPPATQDSPWVDENLPAGTRVAQFFSSDPDGDNLSFMVFDAGKSQTSEFFEIDPFGVLSTRVVFDFEERSRYELVIRAFDGIEFTEIPFSVSVVDLDEMAPVITLIGDEIIFHPKETPFSDPGAAWTDNFDGFGNLYAEGTVNINLLGSYELTYRFSDLAGNSAESIVRKVVVVDESGPMIVLRGAEEMVHPLWMPFVEPGAEAFDAVDGNLTADIVIRGSVDVEKPGIYLIEYSVADKVGNQSIILIRKVVIQNSPPLNVELTKNRIEENAPVGTELGRIIIDDPDDPGDARNYSIWMKAKEENEQLPFYLDENDTLRVGGELDYEKTESYELTIRVEDEFGGRLEKNFEIRLMDAFTPIVRTGEYRITDSGISFFSGEILDRGSIAGLLEQGVVLSEDPNPQLNDPNTRVISSASSNDDILVQARLDMGDADFYYRSYALNREGVAYGSPQKVTKRKRQRNDQFVGWAEAFPIRANGKWWYSPWFGSFFAKVSHERAWIFHTELGWLYVHEPSRGGVWLWSEANEWFWTSKEVFPRAYSSELKSWFVLLAGNLPEVSSLQLNSDSEGGSGESLRFSNLNARDLGNGRWHSPWFGNFQYDEITKEIIHDEFGKISFLPGDGKDDVWIWFQTLKWVWTSSEFYPFIYKNDDLSWYFLHGSSSNMIILFDYQADSWKEIPKL